LDEKIAHAKHIYEWVICEGKSHFTKSELTKAMKHSLKSPQIKKAIDELIERNILRAVEVPPDSGTKPTTVYIVNPVIF
jgi:hypothetical protein